MVIYKHFENHLSANYGTGIYGLQVDYGYCYNADGQRFAMRVEGAYYYIFGDHLGSTTTVVQRDTGERISYQLYEPWDTTRYSASNSRTDYAYTGQMQVDDIYYYNARWYDPHIGRDKVT